MSTIVICFSLAIPISISLSLSLSLSPYLAHTHAHNFLYIRQFQILDSSMLDFVLGFFILIMKIGFRSFQFIFLFVKVKRYINPRTINVNHSNLILALQYPSVSLSLTCTHAFLSVQLVLDFRFMHACFYVRIFYFENSNWISFFVSYRKIFD